VAEAFEIALSRAKLHTPEDGPGDEPIDRIVRRLRILRDRTRAPI
jgi:hypothetical protein